MTPQQAQRLMLMLGYQIGQAVTKRKERKAEKKQEKKQPEELSEVLKALGPAPQLEQGGDVLRGRVMGPVEERAQKAGFLGQGQWLGDVAQQPGGASMVASLGAPVPQQLVGERGQLRIPPPMEELRYEQARWVLDEAKGEAEAAKEEAAKTARARRIKGAMEHKARSRELNPQEAQRYDRALADLSPDAADNRLRVQWAMTPPKLRDKDPAALSADLRASTRVSAIVNTNVGQPISALPANDIAFMLEHGPKELTFIGEQYKRVQAATDKTAVLEDAQVIAKFHTLVRDPTRREPVPQEVIDEATLAMQRQETPGRDELIAAASLSGRQVPISVRVAAKVQGPIERARTARRLEQQMAIAIAKDELATADQFFEWLREMWTEEEWDHPQFAPLRQWLYDSWQFHRKAYSEMIQGLSQHTGAPVSPATGRLPTTVPNVPPIGKELAARTTRRGGVSRGAVSKEAGLSIKGSYGYMYVDGVPHSVRGISGVKGGKINRVYDQDAREEKPVPGNTVYWAKSQKYNEIEAVASIRKMQQMQKGYGAGTARGRTPGDRILDSIPGAPSR